MTLHDAFYTLGILFAIMILAFIVAITVTVFIIKMRINRIRHMIERRYQLFLALKKGSKIFLRKRSSSIAHNTRSTISGQSKFHPHP